MRVTHLIVVLASACGNNGSSHPIDARSIDAPEEPPFDAPPMDAAVAPQAQVSVAWGTGPGGDLADVSANVLAGPLYGTQVAVDGPCTMYLQTQSDKLSAGTINVTGTNVAYTLTPTGARPNVNYTTMPAATSPLFTAGATIQISAAGAEFPQFSGSVTAPELLTGFTPPTTVSRAGYTAQWTASTGPKVWVILIGIHGSAQQDVLCRVDDTGSFAVPASTFALLPSTDDQILVALARVSEHQLTSPQVSLVAVHEIASPDLLDLTP